MIKTSTLICLLISFSCGLSAQDSVISRVILIGDAGKMDAQQKAVIDDAAANIITGKTTVLFLGDNIYPSGMALPGDADSTLTRQVLTSQFSPMRKNGAAVYFIPGNHDWDKSGRKGLAKIKAQGAYLEDQHDPLLKLVPANGCPDPIEINISDKLVIIAFDSEWWLFPYNKSDADSNCSCNTSKDVIEKMEELLYKNRYKIIVLASHHPFKSYGNHGGYYSLKDHLFPFTSLNENLYIPLPVIGSLYPLLRTVFLSPEDQNHPLYKDMVKQIDGVFEDFPNIVHVSGHEHGLQFINDEHRQVVSGAGAKKAYVKKGKLSLFANKTGGYVTADQLSNNTLRLSYHTLLKNEMVNAFTHDLPYTDLKSVEDSTYTNLIKADSVLVQAHPAYDSVSRFHRTLFGENYRKEWATPTLLPVIRLSEIKGGLTPMQRGGGHQSLSLRLKDKDGREYVLRSVNKFPEILLPPQLRETLAKEIITDAMSAQHPYSALVVPVLANAARVPHANPIIGLVAPDKNLGIFEKDFVNTVCLLEEREPLGKSENVLKMYKELDKDNDNQYDSALYFRARLLDLFMGDWDRHEDQWRGAVTKNRGAKRFTAVPRDRDQVFHVMQGVFPTMATRPWIAPMLHDFNGKIKQVNAFFLVGSAINKRFLSGFSYDEWMKITNEFVAAMTDSVLEAALSKLPAQSYNLRHEELMSKLKERRSELPAAMTKYYKFFNRIVDLQTSDKNELISFTDAPSNGLKVQIFKINKEGKIKDLLYDQIFYSDITKEIRLYVDNGNDSVLVNDHSSIKLRIISKKGEKHFTAVHSDRKIKVYGSKSTIQFAGDNSGFRKIISDDSLNSAYVPANSYNKITPSIIAGFNLDDGLLLGASVKFTNQGFRKKPYASEQLIAFQHSFSTTAFKFRFHGEWLQKIGKADLVLDLKSLAPNNTQNFFGAGNESEFNKTGNYKKYYRARFALHSLDPSLRWHLTKNSLFSVGPTFQYYHYDKNENKGRFIENPFLLHSYDSATISDDKLFGGIAISFSKDSRNSKLLPVSGAYFNIKLVASEGLNKYSRSLFQVIPEFAVYKTIDKQSAIVIANRLGGGFTAGKPTFFQSMFLGGQENLFGYRQYRFAGSQMVYNNFEIRIKAAETGSYILPGQLGVVAFYDAGKVWAKGYNSRTIHQGVGGGLYFAPAQLAVLQLVAGYSREGWYPYLTLGFRF